MPLRSLPLDPRGHLISRKPAVDVLDLDNDELEAINADQHEPFANPVIMGSGVNSCGWCGERPQLRIHEDRAVADSACAYSEGITTTTILSVTSGKLVVADSLHPVFNWDMEQWVDYNSALGQAQAVWAMAAQGCAFGPVGNSCPGLYRTGEGTYIVASPGVERTCTPQCDEDCYKEACERPLLEDKDCLAGVVTDLWAYSMADYGLWTALGGDPNSLGWAPSVIDFPVGHYRVTHHTGEKGFGREGDGTKTFAHIERVS